MLLTNTSNIVLSQCEKILTVLCVNIPTFLLKTFPSLNGIISFIFLYAMLQALALLYGFLVNVGINIGTLLGGHHHNVLQGISLDKAFSIFIINFSTISLLVGFGRATWILAWANLKHFPYMRLVIKNECTPRGAVILASIPLTVTILFLLIVPLYCVEDNVTPMSQMICTDSPLRFLQPSYAMAHRSFRLTIGLVSIQFVQISLHLLVRWTDRINTRNKRIAFVSTLLALCLCSSAWVLEWVIRHVEYDATFLRAFVSPQWDTLSLLLLQGWISWFVCLAIFDTSANKEHATTSLVQMFKVTKFTFVFFQVAIFIRACWHPQMGLVHAQLEMTIMNIIIPFVYVATVLLYRSWSLLEVKTVVIGFPVSLLLSVIIYKSSEIEKPYVICVLLMFFGNRILRQFCDYSARRPLMKRNPFLNRVNSITSIEEKDDSSASTIHLLGQKVVYKAGIFLLKLLLLVMIFLMAFGLLGKYQASRQWYPELSSYNSTSSVKVFKHTELITLKLSMATNSSTSTSTTKDPHYAACDNKWYGYSLIDFALLSNAAYLDSEESIQLFVSDMMSSSSSSSTPSSPVEIRHLYMKSNYTIHGRAQFFEIYSPAANVSVIAVRGTDIGIFSDFIEDIRMFSEPIVFTILSSIFPTIRIWPDITASTMIEFYHEMMQILGIRGNAFYFEELVTYVSAIKDRNVVLTGHSLGGAVAQVVGSITKNPVVAFAPPGVVQSYGMFVREIFGNNVTVDRNTLHHQSMSVLSDYDPFAIIGSTFGMIQRIQCSTPHLSMQLSCHMIEGTICNLIDHCGDKRFSSCSFEHGVVHSLAKVMVLPSRTSLTIVVLTIGIAVASSIYIMPTSRLVQI